MLKAVEVPHKSSVKSKFTRGRACTPNPETISVSSRSTHRDFSNEYETPATSVAVTPAEFVIDKPGQAASSKSLPLRAVSARVGFESPFDNVKGKRKRTALDDELEADQRLAEALQAEEYGERPKLAVTRSRREILVLDSDDDELPLSEPPSDMDLDQPSDDESIIIDRRAMKKIKTNAASSLPTRRARDKARTSIAQKASLGIMDSDDEEEEEAESEYTSEADSDVLSDAETLDSIMDSNDIQTAATVTAAPNTLPAASNAPIRRQTVRRWRSNERWEDRVPSTLLTPSKHAKINDRQRRKERSLRKLTLKLKQFGRTWMPFPASFHLRRLSLLALTEYSSHFNLRV